METVAAMAIIAILGASLMVGLLAAHRHVAVSRVMTAGRIILQRNIDRAMGVPFLSNITRAEVLAETATDGTPYSHEGIGTATSLPVLTSNDGRVLVTGTLTRIVRDEPIPNASALSDVSTAKLLRVTFRLRYNYLNRNYTQELASIRAQDDQ